MERFEDKARRNALRGRCFSKTSSHNQIVYKNREKGKKGRRGYLKDICVPLLCNSKVVKGKNVSLHLKLGAKIRTYFSLNDEGGRNEEQRRHVSSREIKT